MVLVAGASAPATSATIDCFMSVEGKVLIDGPCQYRSMEGGSFQIGNKWHFAQVALSRTGAAQGFWNEEAGANHAHTPLGDLIRNGGCWVNKIARLCAWKPGTRPK
jgi:hypothetical protein